MPRRQGRAVVLVNAGLSAAIIAVIAGVSVFRSPPSPPTVQEFAPANPARQQGGGGTPPAPPRTFATGPLARPAGASGVPGSLQCWQWPDGSTTQTFDRQAPPCIPSWDAAGGNGGAVTRGVTATEVRIGVPVASVSAWEPLASFFNRHYEFYGRSIRLVPLGIVDLASPDGSRAAASSAAEHDVFATLDDPTAGDGDPRDPGVFLDALSRAGVLGVFTRSNQLSTTALAADAPFGWSVPPPLDIVEHDAGTAVCRELSGHDATAAKQTAGLTRRFAAVVPSAAANGGSTFDLGALSTALGVCHQHAELVEYDPSDPGALDARLASIRDDGVTTLLPFASAATVASVLMPAASRVGFTPEWFVPGLTQQAAGWAAAPGGQLRSLFGVAPWERRPSGQSAAAQALREVAPGARFDAGQQSVYAGLALLAAGLQLAGPRVTPARFADGLANASFANPGAGGPPAYQATVGFEDVDHAMLRDVAQVWWRGSGWCFVGRGRRWVADDLPFRDPGFFDLSRGC